MFLLSSSSYDSDTIMSEYSFTIKGDVSMFEEKVIIVTGGSNGMGKYMAQKFATEGANVVITGRDLDRLKAAQVELGENVHIFQMDVRNIESVDAMVAFTHENLVGLMDS